MTLLLPDCEISFHIFYEFHVDFCIYIRSVVNFLLPRSDNIWHVFQNRERFSKICSRYIQRSHELHGIQALSDDWRVHGVNSMTVRNRKHNACSKSIKGSLPGIWVLHNTTSKSCRFSFLPCFIGLQGCGGKSSMQ